MTVKYCHCPKDIPIGPHFAIITGGSVSIPGDERSRQCPGHGYPASTERYIEYAAYTDHDEWTTEVARRQKSTYAHERDFLAIAVTPAVVETTVSVKVNAPSPVATQLCPRCFAKADMVARDGFATRHCICGNTWRPAEDAQPRRSSFDSALGMCVS